jgi:hypothetical protein
VAYSLADFHDRFLAGHTLAIACPKLDQGHDVYLEKLRTLIDIGKVRSITVMIMEVPCCMGLFRMAQQVAAESARKAPIHCKVVSVGGEILRELTA